jgi:uncharacterized iron-regulated membrane protein
MLDGAGPGGENGGRWTVDALYIADMLPTGNQTVPSVDEGAAPSGERPTQDRGPRPTAWRRFLLQPQRMWWRRALFQVHLWSGIGVGLYILMISITGSVLVYRNELFRVSPAVLAATEWLLDLHDNLLAGEQGRMVNGFGAVAVLALAITGLVIWWPGVHGWRRSLTLPRGIGWRRTMWHLHSMLGFWTLFVTLILGFSGAYFAFPDAFQSVADWLEPLTDPPRPRVGDEVLYWLAYLHFGRINGIGIPCSGPGFCDQATKATWALLGLVPGAMFVTGVVVWWNRVLRRWWHALAAR